MLVRGTCIAVALFGCKFSRGFAPDEEVIQDGRIEDPDAPPADARVDAPPNSTCYGTGLLVDCYQSGNEPTNTEVWSNMLIDTGNAANCTKRIPQTGTPEICLRTAVSITITGPVRFRGPRPIALLATDSITITGTGTLDVSSSRSEVGAGGETGPCAIVGAGQADTSPSANAGAGGGGGGGFGSQGGRGGTSDGNGGEGGGTTALTQLRGGCRGGKGGTSNDGAGGDGGRGGGAVYLIAGNKITVPGTIKANGSGGNGAPNKAGGGGGGSGGLIAFDAPMLEISGTVYANGGGGGEGGGGGFGGQPGDDPSRYDQRAAGGLGNLAGGNGGGGSAFANSGANGLGANNGGGGGGGGAGRIKAYQAAPPTGKFSPPAN